MRKSTLGVAGPDLWLLEFAPGEKFSLSLQEEEEEIARGTTGYWGCGRQYKVDLRVDLTEKVNRTKMEEEEKEVLGLDQI